MICAIGTNLAQRMLEHERAGKSLLHRLVPVLGMKSRRRCLRSNVQPLCTAFLDPGRVEWISLGMGGPAGDVLNGWIMYSTC
jgi:hypothetical protein